MLWQWLVSAAQDANRSWRSGSGSGCGKGDSGANMVDGYCGYYHWWLLPLVATGSGEAYAVKLRAWRRLERQWLSYGRQRLCGARAAESSLVRARSCRALAGDAGDGGTGGSGLRLQGLSEG